MEICSLSKEHGFQVFRLTHDHATVFTVGREKKTTAKLFELLPLQSDTWKGTVCPLSFHAAS